MELLSIRNGTTLHSDEGVLTVNAPRLGMSLGRLSPGIRDAIGLLFERSVTEDEIFQRAVDVDGFMAGPYVTHLIRRIEASGLIHRTIFSDSGAPVATLIPLAAAARRTAAAFDPEASYSLCRFVTLRSEDGSLVLDSARTAFRFVLHDRDAAACVLAFAETRVGSEAPRREYFAGLLDALVATAVLREEPDSTDDPFRTWEPHDLLFHTRTRLGRHPYPYGGTYRFEGVLEPLPAVKPPMEGEVVELAVPDLDVLMRSDPPLAKVMETRRSNRRQGEQPITVGQLGELLYRTFRVRSVFGGKGGELSSRPYPGGGAIYELEAYAIVDRCDGLPSALYHYCPRRHVLTRINARTPPVEQLLESAYLTLNRESRPQVVLTLTARFGRVAQKYESMAYALILKDVGVVYQSLYLVTTAMGLAGCALGGGDSELFAAASGLTWSIEGSVGEFAVGSSEGAH